MTRIQIRRDTSTNWSVNNPTPANGEPCYETDTRKFKIGDGVTKYTNLPYQGGGGGSAPTNMVTTDTAQDITANKTFYGEIRVGADNNYATLAKFSKEALVSGDSTLYEHIDLGEATFVVQGNLGKKVYETDKYVCKKYINVDDLSDNTIKMDNSISSQVAHMAMLSDKYIDLTLGASGATYTAPADGWLYYYASSKTSNTAHNAYCRVSQSGRPPIELRAQPRANFTTDSSKMSELICLLIPIVKGDFVLSYRGFSANETNSPIFRFYYSIGSQPTL